MSNITVLGLVLGVPLAAAIVMVVVLLVNRRHLRGLVAEFPQREAAIRSDARKRSRIVHMASISEQLAPLLPGFRYNPKDVQWIGGAVDAIVWNGLEAGGNVEIVFLDVKTGPGAHLTGNQRRIRDAIAWKRIAFEEYRPPETPLLVEALPLELSDGEAAPVCEDQADDEPDQFGPAHVPVSFMREVIASEEPGS
jgi:predicted Holliday junction resolvase-like endonuclease